MFFAVFSLFIIQAFAAPSHHLGIIDGENATLGEFPYIVAVEDCDGLCFVKCGGVLLTESWILTAGHCNKKEMFDDLQAHVGITNVDDTDHQFRHVVKIIVHPKFDEHASISSHDIAVMKLKTPLILDDRVKVAVLPKPNTDESSGNATVTGWGAIQTDPYKIYPNDLQKAVVPIVEYNDCMAKLKAEVGEDLPEYNNTAVCTGPYTGGIGPCYGDSGSPLIQDDVVVGLVSWGSNPCAFPGALAVYTKVSSFIDWIQKNIDEELTFES
ncbi:trypsin-1-like [Diabrotica virgifera virgifera]|uniref:Trypsin-1-like n=1 Tax=Diabrotica virgifera virgifera TaxID=50390 RepID=A0A6P7GMD4_DIAVI|nr:trypsin-1-like [Diabrotica virgifera virgifera]